MDSAGKMSSNSRLSCRSNSSLKENSNNGTTQKASDEMIIRKYKVLPNIRRSESVSKNDYYRPSGALPMNSYEDYTNTTNSSKQTKIKAKKPPIARTQAAAASPAPTQTKNVTMNHFSGSQNSLNKMKYHHIHETMDLDEDLPINPIKSMDQATNRSSYTTPAERTLISPINRPPAPSPSKSIMKHYNTQRHDSDSDDSLN